MFPPQVTILTEESTDRGIIGFPAPCTNKIMHRAINKQERALIRELKFLYDQANQYKRPPEALQQRIAYVTKQLVADVGKKYRSMLAETN